MLKWCSFCQQFQGEVPPFENFEFTHGMCASCSTQGLELTDGELDLAKKLKGIQARLRAAGKSEDLGAAGQIVETAIHARMRPVDILLGLIAPLLYEVGEDWSRGIISVADEHRFTAFCEKVFELLEVKVRAATPQGLDNKRVRAMLINAPGNRHSLAIRILGLGLMAKGVEARTLFPSPSFEDQMGELTRVQPDLILVSMALAEQRPGAAAIADFVAGIPGSRRPRIIVGGYAVKLGTVAPIAGVELMSDISSLHL